MKTKLTLVLLFAICLNFVGCGKLNEESSKGSSSEKIVVTSSDPNSTSLNEKVLVKVAIRETSNSEKTYNKPEDITIFKTAIETGIPIKVTNRQLKPPPYYIDFYYSNNEKAEYFLYINDGWVYNNGNGAPEAYTLSKDSTEKLNRLIGG